MTWTHVEPRRRRVVMWGAADQARVNAPILRDQGVEISLLVDDTPGLASPLPGVPIVHGWEAFSRWLAATRTESLGFVIAIGNPYGHIRISLAARLQAAGLDPVSIADRTAQISASAVIGDGLQAMPMAIVHHYAVIGAQCIINTRALVEHDCVLEPGVEVGPGAILCGRVHVGTNTWIAAGAVVRPRVRIGANSIVGAGAVVVSDIPEGVIAMGVPARPVADRESPSAIALAASQR